jgi:hypothetical protein
MTAETRQDRRTWWTANPDTLWAAGLLALISYASTRLAQHIATWAGWLVAPHKALLIQALLLPGGVVSYL